MHCQTDRQHGCFLWRHCLRLAYSDDVQCCNKDYFGNVQFAQNLNLQAMDSWLHSVSLQPFFPCSGIGRSGCQSTKCLVAFISWLHSVSLQPFFPCSGIGRSGCQSTKCLVAYLYILIAFSQPAAFLSLCSGTPFLSLSGIHLYSSFKSKLKTCLFFSAYWSVVLPIHHQ